MAPDSPEEPKDNERRTCCQKLKGCVSLAPEGATPVNYKVMSLCVLALFSSSLTITFLFPFLPEMVLHFGYAEEEKGYYAGLIASAMFAGRAFGSYFWGWLSDRKGRRPILIVTIIGNGIFALVFGFSRNVTEAFLFRFFTGLCNGSVGTAKTILYEISDDTNQAIGMTTLSLAWGGGIILGPAIGGEQKASEEVEAKEELIGSNSQVKVVRSDSEVAEEVSSRNTDFRRFLSLESVNCDTRLVPYMSAETQGEEARRSHTDRGHSKAALISSCTALPDAGRDEQEYHQLALNTTRRKLSLSENALSSNSAKFTGNTREKANGCYGNSEDYHGNGSAVCSNSHSAVSADALLRTALRNQRNRETLDHGIKKEEDLHGNDCNSVSEKATSPPEPRPSCCVRLRRAIKNSSFVTLIRERDVRHAILLYTIFSFAVIGFEDVLTIWASTEPIFDGLGFSTDQIGTVITAASIPLFCLQIFLFPFLTRHIGLIRTFWICGGVSTVLVLATPMLHLVFDKPGWLWAGLMCTQMPLKMAVNCCFASTSLFINNSVSTETVGSVNGIAMTATAIARTLAPTIGGSLFAWSISYGTFHIGAPFDVNLPFLLFSVVFWLATIYSVFTPDCLNRQSKK